MHSVKGHLRQEPFLGRKGPRDTVHGKWNAQRSGMWACMENGMPSEVATRACMENGMPRDVASGLAWKMKQSEEKRHLLKNSFAFP